MRHYILLALALVLPWLPGEAKKSQSAPEQDYRQWALRMADSEMRHNTDLWMTDFLSKPKFDYTHGLMATAFLKVYETTGKTVYLNHVLGFANYFILPDGSIRTYKQSDYNLDKLEGGYFLFDLQAIKPMPQYQLALDTLRAQLRKQPRTSEGGFWHKKRYEQQMWLDGLYMAEPFYARYAQQTGDTAAFTDVARQFLLVDKHTYHKPSKLNYHGWDASKAQQWADKKTGCSPNLWGRSIGWYAMALVDVLDYMPADHPQRDELVTILQRLCKGLVKVQDKKSLLWYQLPVLKHAKGNYLESSASIMYIYTWAKAARMGYVDASYRERAKNAYDAYIRQFVQYDEKLRAYDITNCCGVAGLGGNPYRDGSVDYYLHEVVRNNDPKTVGPFILTSLELADPK